MPGLRRHIFNALTVTDEGEMTVRRPCFPSCLGEGRRGSIRHRWEIIIDIIGFVLSRPLPSRVILSLSRRCGHLSVDPSRIPFFRHFNTSFSSSSFHFMRPYVYIRPSVRASVRPSVRSPIRSSIYFCSPIHHSVFPSAHRIVRPSVLSSVH